MDYIYIDGTSLVNGDGSEASPYNNWASLLARTTLNHPVTVSVKRGSIFGSVVTDTNQLFYNKTDSMSYITTYGDLNQPDPLYVQSSNGDYCFVLLAARKVTIRKQHYHGDYTSNHCVSVKPVRIASTERVDAWLEDCTFSAKPNRNQSWSMALRMNGDGGPVAGAVSYFGYRRCTFVDVPRGAWLIGNSKLPSGQTTNIGDRYYGKGIRADDSVYINVGGDGCIISNAYTPNALTPTSYLDEDTSGMMRPYYRNTRTDMQAQASVAVWFSNCNKALIYKPVIKGQYGSRTGFDKYAYDFDILCWDCVVYGGYSEGNSGLLMTSNYAGQVSSRPSGTSVDTWYYTNRWGNGNNLLVNCVSFNDGLLGKSKVLWQGYTYNLQLQNTTIIDTISTEVNAATMYQESTAPIAPSDGRLGLVFKNVLILAPAATTLRVLNTDTGTNTPNLTSVSYSDLYSPSTTPVYATGITSTSNISTAPKYLQLPFSAPSTLAQAMGMAIGRDSVLFTSGTANTWPDFNNSTGSYIGAVNKT